MNVSSAPELHVHLGMGEAVNSVLRDLHHKFFSEAFIKIRNQKLYKIKPGVVVWGLCCEGWRDGCRQCGENQVSLVRSS